MIGTRALAGALLFALAASAPATALDEPEALGAASAAFAKIDDYRMTIAVHETDGSRVEERTYRVLFKKPTMERIDVVAGPGRGGGIVWLGGDKVKGHRGGILSGIRLVFDIHNSQVTTLRGDSVDTATIPSMLADFTNIKGTISAASGPSINGAASVALTLDVATPATNHGLTREILYLSNVTHLPVRRERFAGPDLVKSENVTDMQTDVGLTGADFPW